MKGVSIAGVLILIIGHTGFAGDLPDTLIREEIKPGVIWYSIDHLSSGNSSRVNLLVVKPGSAKIDIVELGDTLLPVSGIAERSYAIAAVNGSFFNMRSGGPAVFVQDEKKHIYLAGRSDKYSSEGALAIDKKGMAKLVKRPDNGWKGNRRFRDILSSGPVLIWDGAASNLGSDGFHRNRHPRTSVGIQEDGTLLLLTVDGRSEHSAGMVLEELQQFMLQAGCTHALNLDGGGSTSMWIRKRSSNGIVNFPSDNRQFDHRGVRPISNAILVF